MGYSMIISHGVPQMSSPVDRAINRHMRRDAKRKNHDPLLKLVGEELGKKSVKPNDVPVKPLTEAQRLYDSAMHANSVTFGVGPAGTGKTWFAAIRAAEALKNKEIERIIITRPAVEAGESLGFMPGEMDEKFEPYFRPVRDALEEKLGSGTLEYHLRNGTIEARPLAFLRGASLKNAWLIADEMQNATRTQMKMLLTRIGENARFIINGDPTQCDLPSPSASGLADAIDRLHGIAGIATVRFTHEDVVRSGICQEIVRAYSNDNNVPLAARYNDDAAGVRRTLGAA